MSRAAVIKLVCCIDNDIVIDLTNLSLVSTALLPSVPSQDKSEKINDLEKKIIAQGEHTKKVFGKKIKIRGLETKMKKNQAEQEEKIKTLEETIEKLEEKSQSQDRKIAELEQKFQALTQYITPTVSAIMSQLEDLNCLESGF